MKEDLLQFAWLYKLFSQADLVSDTNENIEVINVGQLNRDSGPDFFNAKIKIDGTLWVGNVEIHDKSSDWYKHKHHTNEQYNNVILHVVQTNDQTTFNEKKIQIPTIKLRVLPSLVEKYNSLIMQATAIPCGKKLRNIKEIYLFSMLTYILYEKFEKKYRIICDLLLNNHNDWNQTFYILLVRNFGFGINSDPFELLAKSVPLKVISKHADNSFQVEALLFGQAGFLEELIGEDDYFNDLKKEYLFLAKKYRLQPLERHMWKFLRLRPNNFPTIRIAQLCNLLTRQQGLFSKVLHADTINDLRNLLDVEANSYWTSHFRFNVTPKANSRVKQLGRNAKDLIILNTIIPFLFTYGKHNGIESYERRAMQMLETLKPEQNSIITRWKTHKIEPENAFQSQALIYLYRNYCNVKKCLSCRIGHQILTKKE